MGNIICLASGSIGCGFSVLDGVSPFRHFGPRRGDAGSIVRLLLQPPPTDLNPTPSPDRVFLWEGGGHLFCITYFSWCLF